MIALIILGKTSTFYTSLMKFLLLNICKQIVKINWNQTRYAINLKEDKKNGKQ